MNEKILVIKLGAIGDFIQAGGPFAAIRSYHEGAYITLLTSSLFAEFAAKSPWFDEVWVDTRPKLLDLTGWLSLRSRLCSGGFQRVYDLQTSDRSQFYFRLFWPNEAPQWSGISRGCSHPHLNPDRDLMHTLDRQAEQLVIAGLSYPPAPDFSWVQGDIFRFQLNTPYAVLVPGGARHRPAKRWPIGHYKNLARHLNNEGLKPIVIGTVEEVELADQIIKEIQEGVNLAGQTTLEELFLLAKGATYAIGNDTGPMHLFSVQGCPSVVLYSNASDPAICAQRGSNVTILRRPNLKTLSVSDVLGVLSSLQLP